MLRARVRACACACVSVCLSLFFPSVLCFTLLLFHHQRLATSAEGESLRMDRLAPPLYPDSINDSSQYGTVFYLPDNLGKAVLLFLLLPPFNHSRKS